jgi:arylsulfatase A-like enzyme
MTRPNIVMIVADDVNLAYHGCFGGRTPTPWIDLLAREGVRLDRACCVAPLCNPSRWSLFTGQFAGRSPHARKGTADGEPTLIHQNAQLTASSWTLAKALRAAGWFTAHIGKWHSQFGDDFGEQVVREELPMDADPLDPAVDGVLRRNHDLARHVVRRWGGFEHADRVSWGNLDQPKMPHKLRHHNVPWMTEGALESIDTAVRHKRPFYLHLANSVPHGPDCHRSLGRDLRLTPGGRLAEVPHGQPPDATVMPRLAAAGLPQDGPLAGINAGVVQIDDQIGAIVERLRAHGIERDTIVIYCADHGVAGKGSCHYPGVNVPVVMRWPAGLPGGRAIPELISYADLVPTLLEACGVAAPDGHVLDGASVLGVLAGREEAVRTSCFSEMGWARSVTVGSWRYIAWRHPDAIIDQMSAGVHPMAIDQMGRGAGSAFGDLSARFRPGYFDCDQLYHVGEDPLERTNRIADPACAAALERCRSELAGHLQRLGTPFRAEPHAFVRSPAWRTLVERRMADIATKPYHPQGHDSEAIYAGNLHDPEQP